MNPADRTRKNRTREKRTKVATPSLQPSPKPQAFAISSLERLLVETKERAREPQHLSLQGGMDKRHRDAVWRVREIRAALKWAHGQATGKRFLLLIMLQYSVMIFLMRCGVGLWRHFTDPSRGTLHLGERVLTWALFAAFAGTILGFLNWWRRRQLCANLLEPELEKIRAASLPR